MARFHLFPVVVITLLLSIDGRAEGGPVSTAKDGWNFGVTPEELSGQCTGALDRARRALAALEKDEAPTTLQRVYGAHDAMMLDLQSIQHVSYLKSVHPDSAVQAAAEDCIRDYSDFAVSMKAPSPFLTLSITTDPS